MRSTGVFNFSSNFEALIAAPLDARGAVQSYSELTDGSLPYPYVGMVVAVTSDTGATTNGLYILKDTPATVSGNWYKLAEGAGTSNFGGVTSTAPVDTDNTDPLNPVISMARSDTSTDGYLDHNDWNTFNDKGTSNFGGVTSLAGQPVDTDNTDPLNPVISMARSDTSTDGYLDHNDWNTFNDKGTSNFGGVTSLAGQPVDTDNTDPLNPVISMARSDTSTDGYLDHNDWNTFNNKGSSNITGVTYSGTTQIIGLSDGGTFSTDINTTQLTTTQFSTGISTHSYQYIDDASFTGTTISGQTYEIIDLLGTAKLNIVVLDVVSSDPYDHLVNLPTLAVNEAGVLFRIIAKQANLSYLNRFVLVFSEINRIIAPSIKTEYNGSYFAPLETMESIELIWDGYDWLVTNINKQPYVALNAENFVDMNANALYVTDYLERNINNLL